jgi:hypothetical protein
LQAMNWTQKKGDVFISNLISFLETIKNVKCAIWFHLEPTDWVGIAIAGHNPDSCIFFLFKLYQPVKWQKPNYFSLP